MVKRRDIIRRKHTKAAQVKVEKAVDNTNKTLVLSEPFSSLSGVNIKELNLKFSGLKPNDYRQIVRLEAKLSGGIPSFDLFKISSTLSIGNLRPSSQRIILGIALPSGVWRTTISSFMRGIYITPNGNKKQDEWCGLL